MMTSLLLVTDFSAAADHAAQRAVLLARHHGADLALAHLAGSGPPDADERLPRCAAMLARRHRLPVRSLGTLDEAGLRDAATALTAVLVLGWPAPEVRGLGGLRRSLARRLLSPPCRPLLLVRGPAMQAYARPLVALGTAPGCADDMLQAAAAFAPDAVIELFHAVDTRAEMRLTVAQASVRSLGAFRRALDRQAHQHLRRVSSVLDARRNRLRYTLGRGDPAQQILVQQEHGGADFVVVGHPHRPHWLAWLTGSTAAALLPRVGCDLLIWPEPAAGANCQNAADAGPYARAPR
jgi:nucleotide-binding universal stress UspA family protein